MPGTLRLTLEWPGTQGISLRCRARLHSAEPHSSISRSKDLRIYVVCDWLIVVYRIFDPDVTGGGHQPNGRDQFMAAYKRFQVLNTRFRIDFAQVSQEPLYVGWAIRRSVTTSSVQDYIEQGDMAYTIVGDTDGSNGVKTMQGSAVIANHVGAETAASGLEGTDTAEPDEQLYLHVFAGAMSSTYNAVAMRVGITLDYVTKFREKKVLAAS